MIGVREIHKSYGNVRAVRGIGFEIPAGIVAGLLGPNGAGKSTAIRIMTGYLPPDRGSVTVAGIDAGRRSLAARRRIGYLPEAAPLYPEMRAIDYLRFRTRLYGVPFRRRGNAVAEAIQRCGLEGVERRRIGRLSKGYRQRVGLAAAIVHDPPVLVLDEPTNGLDPVQTREVRGLIRELGRERTILMSSHILAEIERTCDRIIVLARGRVRADGTPEDLIRQASEPGAVELEIKPGEGDDPARTLRAIAGVPGVESCAADGRTTDGWTRVRVRTDSKSGIDPREAIPSAVAATGGGLREMHAVRASLEQVFLHAIEQSEDERDDGVGTSGEPASARTAGAGT